MSNDVSNTRRNQQQTLEDMQADYQAKRKRMQQDQAEDLESLNYNFKNKKAVLAEDQSAAINHIQKRNVENVQEAREKSEVLVQNSQERYNNLQEKFRAKIDKERQAKADALAREKASAAESVNHLRENNRERLDSEAVRGGQQLQALRGRYQDQIQRLKNEGDDKIVKTRLNQENEFKRTIETGKAKNEKIREEMQKNFERTQATGENQIAERQARDKDALAKQTEQFRAKSDKNNEEWLKRIDENNTRFREQYDSNRLTQQEMATQQNDRFLKTYAKKEAQNKETFHIQDEMLNKALDHEKFKHFTKVDQYDSRAEDPFYDIQDRGSRLRESPNHYIVEAYVPMHEKDNIKVAVQKDRVTVSGTRSHKEKLALDDKNVSSASYQTFREEFPLEQPIVTEAVKRERSGDFIRLTIPKLTTNNKKG